MPAKLNRPFITLLGGFLAFGTVNVWAVKFPLSPEELQQQASHVITGTVVEVTSKDQKSEIETAFGNHVDRVFTIILKVKTISKGTGVNADDAIEIEAWKPVRRIPPLPGLQGHTTIPKKGDTVTVYVKVKNGKAYEPVLPNGIVLVKNGKDENQDSGNPTLKLFYLDLGKVLERHYPEATSHVFRNKIHFEHSTRLYVARAIAKTPLGQKPSLIEVRGPKSDGVWCEISFRDGFQPYARSEGATDRQHFTEHIFYPRSKRSKYHLFVTLRLPSGAKKKASDQFVEDFRKLLDSFDEYVTKNGG